MHDLYTTVYGMNFSSADVAIIIQQFILTKIVEYKERYNATKNPLLRSDPHFASTTMLPSAVDDTEDGIIETNAEHEEGESKAPPKKHRRVLDTYYDFHKHGKGDAIRPQHLTRVPTRTGDATALDLGQFETDDEEIDAIIQHIFGSDDDNVEVTNDFIRNIISEYKMSVGYQRVIANNAQHLHYLYEIGIVPAPEAVATMRAAAGLPPLNTRSLLQTPLVMTRHPLIREAMREYGELPQASSSAGSSSSSSKESNLSRMAKTADKEARASATRETNETHAQGADAKKRQERFKKQGEAQMQTEQGPSGNVHT